MKLLFIYYVASGGLETLNRIRCTILQNQGICCHLLYQWGGSGLQNIHNIPFHVTDDDAAIQHLLESEHFDAILVSSNYYMLERIRRLGFQKPVLFEIQGLGTKEKAYIELMEAGPYIRSFCNAVLYPKTNHLMQFFEQLFPEVNQFSFHNPVDTLHFTYRILPKSDLPIIGWIGRIEANKNWRDFIEIGRRMIQLHSSYQLWLFDDPHLGEAAEKAAFEATIEELDLSPHLIRHSNVPHQQMANFLSIIGDSGGFLLSTSITEGFGYAIAEAMSCRCPVVTTNSDGVRSLVIHNVTGKFFSHGNTSEAVNEALQLMQQENLRESIINSAQQHIEVYFTCEQYAYFFIEMLKKLGIHLP